MQYFVTGATGFIGKRLVKALLERRDSKVHFLLRRQSEDKVRGAARVWGVGAERAIPVYGDLTAKRLGVSAEAVKRLQGRIDHCYHLAAVYDLAAEAPRRRSPSTSRARATRSRSPRRSRPGTCTTSARSPPRDSTKACSARTCSRRPRGSSIRTS